MTVHCVSYVLHGKSREYWTKETAIDLLSSAWHGYWVLFRWTVAGLSEEERLRKEMSALLCMSDRQHSQLSDLIPEHSGMSNLNMDLFERILQQVSRDVFFALTIDCFPTIIVFNANL